MCCKPAQLKSQESQNKRPLAVHHNWNRQNLLVAINRVTTLVAQKRRGWRRLALNSTPLPQDFKLLGRCAEVKSKFAFFQEQREGFAINSVIFAQDAFCLIPKILNAVNVVLTVCKFLGMVDTVMDKTHVTGNEGIVEHDLDRTIDNLCSIASKSMHHIDRQVIEIMVSKPCP